MTERDRAATPQSTIPPDDPRRTLTVIHPDSPTARHVSMAGGSYTILVSGAAAELSPEEIADRRKKLGSLVARYRTELL